MGEERSLKVTPPSCLRLGQAPMLLVHQSNLMNPNQQPLHQSYHEPYEPQSSPSLGYDTQTRSQRLINEQPSFQHNSSSTYKGKICTHWRKSGSCPNKRCPYAASHTARNSPRYAKYLTDSTCHQPIVHETAPRPNALEIKDPSPNASPAGSRGATPPAEAEKKVRAFALEIKEAPCVTADATTSNQSQVEAQWSQQPNVNVSNESGVSECDPPVNRSRSRFAN